MGLTVGCGVEDCQFWKDNECTRKYINIDYEITASGFYPICQSYEERGEVMYENTNS